MAGLHVLVLVAFAGLLVWAAIEDMRRRIIENWVSLSIAGFYPLLLLTSPNLPNWPISIGIAVATLTVGFLLFSRNLMGGGDAKLMAAVALWAGQSLFLMFLFVMTIAGGLLAVAMLLRQRFAPALATGKSESAPTLPYGVAITIGGLVVALGLFSGK
jgi:prepilin peptidase CpaA